MAESTFGDLWRRLRIYSPDIPQGLAEEMVNTAVSRAYSSYGWSSLRGVMGVQVPAPYTTGAITATNGATTVTGSGTAWTSALEGMQLVIGGSGPFFEVATVTSGTSLELQTAYSGPGVSASTYAIQQIYLVMPANFGWLTDFVDVTLNTWWTLNFLYTQELVDVLDPLRRTSGANPLNIVATTTSPFTTTLGQVRYELWPRPTSAKTYMYRYIIKPPLMTNDTDAPVFPIRGDIIREGAMAELCSWPGTEDWKNPMFGLDIAALHDKRFTDRLAQVRVEDQNIRPTDVAYESEFKRLIPTGDWWQTNTINLS